MGEIDENCSLGSDSGSTFIVCAWAGATTTDTTERNKTCGDSESAREAKGSDDADEGDDSDSEERQAVDDPALHTKF